MGIMFHCIVHIKIHLLNYFPLLSLHLSLVYLCVLEITTSSFLISNFVVFFQNNIYFRKFDKTAFDFCRDRFRTTINVMCDCLGAKLVDILSVGELGAVTEMDRINADASELVEISKEDSRI